MHDFAFLEMPLLVGYLLGVLTVLVLNRLEAARPSRQWVRKNRDNFRARGSAGDAPCKTIITET